MYEMTNELMIVISRYSSSVVPKLLNYYYFLYKVNLYIIYTHTHIYAKSIPLLESHSIRTFWSICDIVTSYR